MIMVLMFYLKSEADDAKTKRMKLEAQSSSLQEELHGLKSLKTVLESDLENRASQLHEVSDRLGDIESLLGGDANGKNDALEQRLDVAAINTSVRMVILENLPNGSPVKKARQSSQFGYRIHPITGKRRLHRGLDFAVNTGTKIYAPADGVVETVRSSKEGSGNFLRLRHSYGFSSSYSHLKKFAVKAGEFIKKGDLIAYSGNSGLSSGPHLHYEIRFINRALNPRPFVEWDMNNFENIFKQDKTIPWVSLIKTVKQKVSKQLQLSSLRGVTSKES